MRPDLTPTACLPLEPAEAHHLLWMPLALRHKLDGCRLRLSLAEWQALPMTTRLGLLKLPAGPEFAAGARRAGASHDIQEREPARLQVAEVAKALDCDAPAACAWLAAATPFAHYALDKLRRTAPA